MVSTHPRGRVSRHISKKGPAKKTALPSVRLMAPFSMRCLSCEHFIYRGTKFNAKKRGTGEDYLGVPIIGFTIRCTRCAAEIRFRTDPKSSSYVVETGAQRNLDPQREKQLEQETVEDRLDRLEQEQRDREDPHQKAVDALAALEKSTQANRQEARREKELLQIMRAADELQESQWHAGQTGKAGSEHQAGNASVKHGLYEPDRNFEAERKVVLRQVEMQRPKAERPQPALPAVKKRKHLAKSD